jgi:hypothetical protein
LLIKQHVVSLVTLSEVQLAYADTKADGKVNSIDAMTIQQKVVGMDVTLGNRVEVVFVTETEETVYTVEIGNDFTDVPETPDGYVWSADVASYEPPVFTAITNDKVYYLVKE